MKALLLATLLLLPSVVRAEEAPPPAAAPAAAPANPESVDISDLEEDYWRPNKDELEVVQNRRFEKKDRFELGAHYGLLQGEDFENTTSFGASVAYNLTNFWFIEASHHKFSNSDNDFLASLKTSYGFRPDFNRMDSQSAVLVGWVPIYAKFSLLGKKISHFELYLAAGAGLTKTSGDVIDPDLGRRRENNNLTGILTVGNKFYLTEHLLFRVDWRMSRYKDKVTATQGTPSRARGGPGYVEQTETTHDIMFGLGWMF